MTMRPRLPTLTVKGLMIRYGPYYLPVTAGTVHVCKPLFIYTETIFDNRQNIPIIFMYIALKTWRPWSTKWSIQILW